MSTDLALVVGEGCPLFGGVYTLCRVVEEDIHSLGEFVPTVRLRFMGELWSRLCTLLGGYTQASPRSLCRN